MSLPKTYSLAHSGRRKLTMVAELFSENQGLCSSVYPRKNKIVTAGK